MVQQNVECNNIQSIRGTTKPSVTGLTGPRTPTNKFRFLAVQIPEFQNQYKVK